MSVSSKAWLPAAGMLIGLLAGLILRAIVDSRPKADTAPPLHADPDLHILASSNTPSQFTGSLSLAEKLAVDLSMSSGVTRWLLWLVALEKAASPDFPELIRLAQGNTTRKRLVAARWIELNPRQFFDVILAAARNGSGREADELAYWLFREWPKRDAAAAIAALNETRDFGRINQWRHTVAGTVIDNDPERGLRLFAEWDFGNFGPRMTAIQKWAASNPRHAAQFALEHPTGCASQLAMGTIGKEWAGVDPAAALEFAASNPGELGKTLASAALSVWSDRSPAEAAAWLAAAAPRVRNQFSPAFVESWARHAPAEALAWCQQNLNGSSLASAVAGVLTGVSQKDLPAAAALVEAMTPSRARAEAAVAVANRWLPDRLSSRQAVPPDAIAWLSKLDTESLRRTLDGVVWSWAPSDPDSMAKFLTTASSDAVPDYAYRVLAQELVRRDPAQALDWANRLPKDRALDAGGAAFAEWRLTQREAAVKWLQDLPANDPRRQPYFESAVRALAYDPQLTEQLASMNPRDRARSRKVIETMSLPDDRRRQLLDLLDRP